MVYLHIDHIKKIHQQLTQCAGSATGIRDHGSLESAVAQPHMTFGGQDLYPSLIQKVAALGFSLIMNHPFVDGNKRIGHAAMDMFLELNGHRISESIDESERMILAIAAGQATREQLIAWLESHVVTLK